MSGERDITQRQAHLGMEAVITRGVGLRKIPADATPKVWQNHGRYLAGYASATLSSGRAPLGVGLSWRGAVDCAAKIIDKAKPNP